MNNATTPNTSILIVEDEVIVAQDLANTLTRMGYTVVGSAAQGEEALVLARERRPDIVLMDICLAGPMDGVETAERMRRECDLVVIYLTAHSDSATLDRAKLTGSFGYVLKPFEARDLQIHIEMALYKHQSERKLRESAEALQRSNRELTYFNGLMVNREMRMIELKKEIDNLCRQFDQPTRYGYGGDELPGAERHTAQ